MTEIRSLVPAVERTLGDLSRGDRAPARGSIPARPTINGETLEHNPSTPPDGQKAAQLQLLMHDRTIQELEAVCVNVERQAAAARVSVDAMKETTAQQIDAAIAGIERAAIAARTSTDALKTILAEQGRELFRLAEEATAISHKVLDVHSELLLQIKAHKENGA